MTEANVTWNGHRAKVIKMLNDEGKFSLPGTSVILQRGNWGLLCNWVDSTNGGCFEVLPVEIFPSGLVKEIGKNNKDWVGGIDIWSQGISLFSWRDRWDKPSERPTLDPEHWGTDASRPKLLVFIPPKNLNTKAKKHPTKVISKHPHVF